MNYPIYDKNDLHMVPKDGTYEYSDFHDLISDLLERELLEHEAEIGIAKYVLNNGPPLPHDCIVWFRKFI